MAIKNGTAKGEKLTGTRSTDSLYGLGGADTLYGLAGIDNLYGGTGSDKLYGGTGTDKLYGGTGNDYLHGGSSSDMLYGGIGNDTYIVSRSDDRTIESVGQGIDLVKSSVSWTLSANVENLTLLGSSKLNGTGNALANTIKGNVGSNTLSGGKGADKLYGGKGNDTLNGGSGNDTMYGGDGFDTYIVNSTGDKVISTGDSFDIVKSSVSWTLGELTDTLILTGTANINGTGTAGVDYLTGNSGNNVLNGGEADDVFKYSGGLDLFFGGDGAQDKADFSSIGGTHTTPIGQVGVSVNLGTATIGDLAPGTAYTGALKENVTLASIEHIIGSRFGDFIIGGSDQNDIEGGAGIDLIDGGGAIDIISGGDGGDVIRGGKGGDFLYGGTPGTSDTTVSDTFIFGNYTSDFDTDSDNTLEEFDGRFTASFLCDVILDFQTGIDKIGLNEIDAIVGVAGSAFSSTIEIKTIVGDQMSDSSTDARGIIGMTRDADAGLIISLDRGNDGDLAPDLFIYLNNVSDVVASDFIL